MIGERRVVSVKGGGAGNEDCESSCGNANATLQRFLCLCLSVPGDFSNQRRIFIDVVETLLCCWC
jgi:hypothetical protein